MEEIHKIGYGDATIISRFYHGEVCEKRSNFSRSLFRRVYKRAYMIIKKQIELQIQKGEELNAEETNDNIIIFMGRRGTGKSSVMRSFMQSLLDNCKVDDNSGDYVVQLERSNKRIRFIGIDSIDASLLEKQEDIFEAILAKMFNEFLKDNENTNSDSLTYEKRELYQMFSSIYKKHLNIKQRDVRDVYSSETAISNLRDLARSVDIKQEFEKLIEKYIQVKSYCEYGYNEHNHYETFLVVSIDDIDMNVESGFEILEKIQRYLKVNRLIVLLSVNHEQMKLCCQKHFQSVISNNQRKDIEELNRYIDKLADQYMEKAMPSYSRVYLPSFKKMDYDRNNVVKIRDSKNLEKAYSIKQDMFLEAWRKTKIRYDTEGKKRHFLEPESLRELNNWKIYRTYMLEIGDEKSDKFLEVLDFNYRRTMDDLLFRYADEVLQNSESKLFVSLSELHIARRGREIVNEFLHNYSEEFEVNDEIDYFRDDYSNFGYSYGELLRALYWMGRTHIYDKKLVHAILAMYSLTLTKIFYRYKCECDFTDLEESKKINNNSNYKIIKEIMNTSVGGSWSKYLVPILKLDIVEAKGGEKQKLREDYFVGCAKKCLKEEATVGGVGFRLSEEIGAIIDSLKKDNGTTIDYSQFIKLLNAMQWEFLLTLFLSNGEWKFKEKQKPEQIFGFMSNTEEDSSKENIISGETEEYKDSSDIIQENRYVYILGKSDYNIMNFINNIFEFDERLRYFIKKLLILVKKDDSDNQVEAIVNTIIKELLEEENFYSRMYDWRKMSAGMIVPVYSIDIYYNMFKRLVRNQTLFDSDRIEKEELFDVLLLLLDNIENALRKNDEAYQEIVELNEGDKFAHIFRACPFIEKIRNAEDVEKKIYCDYVEKIISTEKNVVRSLDDRIAELMEI